MKMALTKMKQFKLILLIFMLHSVHVFATQPKGKTNSQVAKKAVSSQKIVNKKRKLANESENIRKKIIESYFNCFTKVSTIQTCVNNLVSSDLKDSEKERFYTWLQFNPYKFAGIRECSRKDLQEIRFFGLSTSDYLCASIELDKQIKEIVFFFKPEPNSSLKIFSFYY